jgi:hypothetical protein
MLVRLGLLPACGLAGKLFEQSLSPKQKDLVCRGRNPASIISPINPSIKLTVVKEKANLDSRLQTSGRAWWGIELGIGVGRNIEFVFGFGFMWSYATTLF